MANLAILRAALNAAIYQNYNHEISGSTLNNILNSMVDAIGGGYQFRGVATPETNPGTPDPNVFYIAAQVGTYSNFGLSVEENEVALFLWDGSWRKQNTGAASAEVVSQLGQEVSQLQTEQMVGFGYGGISFKKVNNEYVSAANGSFVPYTNWSRSDYINIALYDSIVITTVHSTIYCAIYDKNKTFIRSFSLSSGANTIDFAAGDNYICLSDETVYMNQIEISIGSYLTSKLKTKISEIENEINVNNYDTIGITQLDNGIFWTNSGTIVAGLYVVSGINDNVLSVGIATQQNYSTIFRNPTVENYGTLFSFVVTDADIANGGKYLRLQTTVGQIPILKLTVKRKINDVVIGLEQKTASLLSLKDKKISIIGDSISSSSRNNAPYWLIVASDVGNQIQSYVTWADIYSDWDGTTPTNKTIGGVLLTSEMIGTLQTFTPIAEDVGKTLGKGQVYNLNDIITWSERLCQKSGAIWLSNTAWSSARMTTGNNGDSGQIAGSTGYSDCTIGRLRKRKDDGSFETPDIVLIYMGTNDMTHTSYARIDNIDIMSGIPQNDLIEGVHQYKAAYYRCIQKVREAYPNATVICCTLNVFKRINYAQFPTNNGIYTLPQMNDAIREIANTMGCGLVEFDKDGITFENCYPTYISDSATTPTHPNNTGHAVMADRALADIKYFLQH